MKAFIGGCDDQFGTKSQLRVAPIKKLIEYSILSDDIEIDAAFFFASSLILNLAT